MTTHTTRMTGLTLLLGVTLGLLSPAAAMSQTAESRYTAAKTRDDSVRMALRDAAPDAATGARTKIIAEARAVIAAYEALVYRHFKSGYADNALFNAGTLAEALHERYGLTTDRDAALRLYERLRKEYPTAPLARQVVENIRRLDAIAEANAPVAPVALTGSTDDRPTVTPAPAGGPVTLVGIERALLPEAVRITITLDREVPFHQELIAGPDRLFFDLKGAKASRDLIGATLRYPSDIVRQIRVGQHPGAIRVVLDFEEVGRHSVYMLYNPFRIVVDAESPAAARAAAALPARADAPGADTASQAADAATPVRPIDAPVAPADEPLPPVTIPEQPPVRMAVSGPAPAAAAPEPTPAAPAPTPAVPVARRPAAPLAPLTTPAPEVPSGNGAGGFSIARQLGLGVSRIVIDPGHGGRDPGAMARGLNEADLTLDIALRLETLLAKEPGVEVVLTRRENVYIPLEERTAIANREGADLFLSIHANTSRNASARGVETYFLSFAASPEAEAVAARENASHAGEMRKLPDIIRAITLNNKLDESRDLAGMVQEALVTRLRRSSKTIPNRGVKKAPFVVLIGAEMPSVLAEVSFLSHRQDLQLLKTPVYKDRIAEALHAAVMRYRRSLKGAAAIADQ